MEVVAHPSLIPTSQQAGTTSDNSEANQPKAPAEIPVGTQPQPQPRIPYAPVMWTTMTGSN